MLLRSIRHPVGFDLVAEMFEDPSLSYAGSHLAGALLDLDPRRAPEELLRLVEHAASQTGRDEAAWGLSGLPSPVDRAPLLRAAAGGRITLHLSSHLMFDWGVEPRTLEAWLASGRRTEADAACAVIGVGAWRSAPSDHGPIWTPEERARLLELAQAAVTQGIADPIPPVRTSLRRRTSNRFVST